MRKGTNLRAKRRISGTRPASRVNEIYNLLLREIISGAIAPGSYLSEVSLVERLNASRTPIREALIHLFKEGLLQKGPFKGYVVASMSLDTIRELFELRLLLEPAAARLAARNPSARQIIQQLEETHLSMQQAKDRARTFQDFLEVSEMDSHFHKSIAEASGNKKMAKVISEIMNQFERFHSNCYQSSPWVSSTLAEHKSVLKAIRTGDPNEAERLMLLHIRKAIDRAKELSLGMLNDPEVELRNLPRV